MSAIRLDGLLLGTAVFLILLVVYSGVGVSALPGYPALALTFLSVTLVPGFFIQRALLDETAAGGTARFITALALGWGTSIPAGIAVMVFHLSLQEAIVGTSLFAGATAALSVYSRPERYEFLPKTFSFPQGSTVLLIIVGLFLTAAVTSPFWEDGRISSDSDDLMYMAYVRDYMDTDHINASEPFFGTGNSVNPRMFADVWVLSQAMIARAAGVAPSETLTVYQPAILIAAAFVALYALTRKLFRDPRVAVVAPFMLLGYAVLDLSANEGVGRNLLLRISQDKMVGTYVFFPVALLFLADVRATGSLRSSLGYLGTTIILAAIHPIPLLFLATTIGGLAVMDLVLTPRAERRTHRFAFLAAPLVLLAAGYAVQAQFLADYVPELNSSFRNEYRVMPVGDVLIGNYHILLNPMLLAAIPLSLLVWWRDKNHFGRRLVVVTAVGGLLSFMLLPVASSIVGVVPPQLAWRMTWMIPVPLIFAVAITDFLPERRPNWAVLNWAPAVLAMVVLASVFVVQETYMRFDGGRYFGGAEQRTLLPWAKGSHFLGGVDHALSGAYRPGWHTPFGLTLELEPLLNSMREVGHPGSVWLTPSVVQAYIPGELSGMYSVDFPGVDVNGPRRQFVREFNAGNLMRASLQAGLDQYKVTHVVAFRGSSSDLLVRSCGAQRLRSVGMYEIYGEVSCLGGDPAEDCQAFRDILREQGRDADFFDCPGAE